MSTTLRKLSVGLAIVTLVVALQALSVHASQAPAQQPTSISGELLRVNVDTKTIAIKPASGADMQFQYDDQTEVSGADKGAAGLATMNGQQVTVYYRTDGKNNLATRIVVQPKK